jgi:phage minor structural protein
MGTDEATDDNSTIANEFGGDIIFDNFTLDVVDERGEDNNIIIAYKKNITGVEMQTDDLDIITDVVPVGKDVDGNALLLPEYHIQSPHFNNYPHPYVNTTDVDVQVVEPETDSDGNVSNADDVMTTEQCYTKMREAVAYMYNSQKVDQLNFTLTVNFIQLENTLEYENYLNLQRVKQVGDYVTINHEPLGLALKGRVNKIVWDCLNLNKKTKKPKIKEIEIEFF